jgi:hypothetical protein
VRSAAQHFVRTVADLIEAGLNEDAGRFALALLWALCRAASECRRVGLQPCEASMIVLMSDRKQIGVRSRGERAPMLWDAGCDAVRVQIASTTSNWRRDGRDANRDCWWDRHGRAHEVSHQSGGLSDRGRWPPRGRSDPHTSSAFRTGRRIKVDGFARHGCWRFYLSARRRFAPVGQERAKEGELLCSVAIGEESEVANGMEAVG